jgi:hypothetical protein
MKNSQRDPAYLTWIRSLPCLICQHHGERQQTPTEAHHFGPRGLSQKVPDRQAVPLCIEHHRTGRTAVHVLGKRFADHHCIEIWQAIEQLNQQYDSGYQIAA